MDTAQLKTFLSVATSGSFSRSAELTHLSQPAITKRIQGLEAELGVKLFDRIGRRVSLTEAGQLFEHRARRLINELEETISSIRSLEGEPGGTLSLGISHHLGLHRLPPILQRYCQAHPKVKLDISFMDSEVAHEAVSRGDVELAAITLAAEPSPQIEFIRLWRDRLSFVCSTDHVLAQTAQPNLQMLATHPCCLPSPATYTGRIIAACFHREGLQLDAVLVTNYMETLARMTEIGLGWSVLPETLAAQSGLLHRIQVPVALSRNLGLICNRQRTRSRAAQAFLDLATGEMNAVAH
jgi:DNA-binding transcriptional LysR family regulator